MNNFLKLAFDATNDADIAEVIHAAENPTENETLLAGIAIGVGVAAAGAAVIYGGYKGVEALRERSRKKAVHEALNKAEKAGAI